MSLLVNDSDKLEIAVCYSVKNGKYTFYEKQECSDVTEEKFFFKRPNWMDQRSILSASVTVNAALGPVMDPYKFMDARIKTLLKDWTLKDEKGRKLEVSVENINRLDPTVVEHVLNKLAVELAPEETEPSMTEETNG